MVGDIDSRPGRPPGEWVADDPRAPRRRGRVLDFDGNTGLGTLDSRGRAIGFHCLEITDGTRTIEVDTEVIFDLVIRLGRPEAARIEPVRR